MMITKTKNYQSKQLYDLTNSMAKIRSVKITTQLQ